MNARQWFLLVCGSGWATYEIAFHDPVREIVLLFCAAAMGLTAFQRGEPDA